MEVLYILIPLAMVLATAAVAAFFWAVKHGQMDDLDTPAWRAVFDEPARRSEVRETNAPREPKTTGEIKSTRASGGEGSRD
jgi:cbb3-type cytochrome oxidase maturation protein